MGGYDLSEMDLQELKQVDVRTVNPDTLVDIKEIEIDRTLPKGERIQEFIRQIRNPYCFRGGKRSPSAWVTQRAALPLNSGWNTICKLCEESK